MTMMRVAHTVTQEFSKTNLRGYSGVKILVISRTVMKEFKIKHFTNSLIEFYYYQILF